MEVYLLTLFNTKDARVIWELTEQLRSEGSRNTIVIRTIPRSGGFQKALLKTKSQ